MALSNFFQDVTRSKLMYSPGKPTGQAGKSAVFNRRLKFETMDFQGTCEFFKAKKNLHYNFKSIIYQILTIHITSNIAVSTLPKDYQAQIPSPSHREEGDQAFDHLSRIWLWQNHGVRFSVIQKCVPFRESCLPNKKEGAFQFKLNMLMWDIVISYPIFTALRI